MQNVDLAGLTGSIELQGIMESGSVVSGVYFDSSSGDIEVKLTLNKISI